MKKKIVFLSGTRADFGKIKSLILGFQKKKKFKVSIFVTGMHLLKRYGSTIHEIRKSGIKNIFKFNNQKINERKMESGHPARPSARGLGALSVHGRAAHTIV